MLKIIKEKGIMLLIFLFFCFLIEFLTFHSIQVSPVANFFFLDIIMLTFFASVIFIIKSNKAAFAYLSVLMLGILALYLANCTLYCVFGDVFSIEYIKLLSEAGEVFQWSFLSVQNILTTIGIFVLYVVINILFIHKNKTRYISNRCYAINGMFFIVPILVVLSLIFETGITFANKNTIVNNRKVNEETFVTNLTKKAMSHYGILTLYYKEIAIVSGNYEMNDGSVALSSDNSNSNSQYNGLLKGKNVITIMAESLQEFCVSERLTPNIWKIKSNGIDFRNNYSVNKTNVSEQIGIAGSSHNFDNKEYDINFALPNMLKKDYKTSYFHDNKSSFYSRNKNIKYYGFENMYFHDDLYNEDFKNFIYPDGLTNWGKDEWSWNEWNYTLDSVTIDRILPNMISDTEKFYSFWTTLSTHGPYKPFQASNCELFSKFGYFDKIEKAIKDREWVNPLKGLGEYEDYILYYQAAVMNLDDAVGKILNELEKRDLMDDTVIVLYADHHVYYHDIYLKIAETDDVREVDKLYKTPTYIYNPKLTNKYYDNKGINYIDKFSSPYIIVPTILDLLGVDFDNRNYLNFSIFDSRCITAFYSHQQRAYMNNVFYTTDCENISYSAKYAYKIEEEKFFDECVLLLDRLFYINDAHNRCIVR